MSDNNYGYEQREHEPPPPAFDSGHHGSAHPEPAPMPSQPVKKRGPKPMTDEPTMRFEGQLFPGQYTAATGVISRLKMENQSTPSAERRRMTINTLVRLGMTIVLEHESALHGKNEHELLDALRGSLRAAREGSE